MMPTTGPTPEEAHVPGELLVRLRRRITPRAPAALSDGSGVGALDAALRRLEARPLVPLHPRLSAAAALSAPDTDPFEHALGRAYRVRFDPQQRSSDEAAALLQGLDDIVAEACPNVYRAAQFHPDDPLLPEQWALEKIRCPQAWGRQRGRPDVVIAVLDTGVRASHEDLTTKLLPGQDFVDTSLTPAPPDWAWEGDAADRDGDPDDDVGHGTHMAGIAAAAAGNALGIAGVAPGCRLLPVRVLARLVHADGRVLGFGTAADVAAGIRWAVQQRCAVLNMSFAFPHPTFAERDALERALERKCVPVAAMGNHGQGAPPFYPAAYASVLAVGAVDSQLEVPAFSQAGAHVDLVAPGVEIKSCALDGGYTPGSGTSMAAACVSGVAALVRAARRDWTARQVQFVLRDTARRPWPLVYPDERVGHGLVDAAAAVEAALGG